MTLQPGPPDPGQPDDAVAPLPEGAPPLPPPRPWHLRIRGALRWLMPVFVLLGLSMSALGMYAKRMLSMPGPLLTARNVVVPRGGIRPVAGVLLREGVIAGDIDFQIAAFVTRHEGGLRASEFTFPAKVSLREVLTILRTARPVQHSLTIPEGLTAKQIAAVFAQAPALSGAIGQITEGSVLPQTYLYEFGMSPDAILARARSAMDRALSREWANRAPDLPLASPREALTLASIVERETALDNERKLVAAVFLNRLRRGMRLQSDPTVVFAASAGAGVLDRPISRADLDRDDPFNTYRIRGLPPGPICAPGLASLDAVLHPAITDDLYFVADGKGGHVFSRTLEEHNRNVARWRVGGNGH